MSMNGHAPEGRFWTAKQAAEFIGVAPNTLTGWCRKVHDSGQHRVGIPPFRRIGNRILRFPVKEFKEWANRFDTPAQEKR